MLPFPIRSTGKSDSDIHEHFVYLAVVELNRAVAVGMADGAAAGLAIADALTSEPMLRNYHLLPAVRADLLAKLGRREEARVEFERAAALTRNAREQSMLLARANTVADDEPLPPPGTRRAPAH